jgi:5-methylcytosine-specific restriction endonuclease McrA
MRRPCLGCGRLIGSGSRCDRCKLPSKRTTHPNRGSGWEVERFRRAVLKRSGGRCQLCGSSERVQAHHRVPLEDGGTNHPSNGVALCSGVGGCHGKVERVLRAERERRKARRSRKGRA